MKCLECGGEGVNRSICYCEEDDEWDDDEDFEPMQPEPML